MLRSRFSRSYDPRVPVTGAPLLERERELEEFERLRAAARRGEGAAAVVEGPAGIGKTRLLAAAGEGAEGLEVLRARASELERDFPFGVVRQLFEPVLFAAGAERRSRLLAGAGGLAERVLSGSAVPDGGGSGDPFAVLLGDDIVATSDALLPKMIDIYERYGRSVIAVQEVARDDISLYGAVKPEFVEDDLARVLDIVEKPSKEEAPSNLAVIGRYVFTPEIFDAIRQTPPDSGGDVQLTDAIALLARQQAVYAFAFDGVRYDIGKKLDYLRATVELAIEREDLGPAFREFLADFVQRKKLI
mgnify:CR=1 FL=1